MTITIDQLIQVLMKEETDDAGMRAVVRALRDEVFGTIDSNGDQWSADGAWDWFNEILGDAGNEKVAGVPTEKDDSSTACVSPATDPAPAVCVWRQLGDRHGQFLRECSKYPTTSAAGDYCSNCGKPIKFTEAKT